MAAHSISGCPQRRNRGAILAIRHRGSSLGDVLQAGRAGISRDRLLRQQHEDDGAGGEPSPEDAGEKHVVITVVDLRIQAALS